MHEYTQLTMAMFFFPFEPRWDVAKALNMDYDQNKDLVDEVCASLPNRDFSEDDPNPLHRIFKSKGFKEYYLQKVQMGQFQKTNTYSQGFSSSVAKNDKKHNVVEIIMTNEQGGGPKPKSLDVLLQEKCGIITSSLSKLDKSITYFQKMKAAISASKNPSGHTHCMQFVQCTILIV